MAGAAFIPAVRAPQVRSPRPRWFVVTPKGLLVRADGERTALPSTAELEAAGILLQDVHYLGQLDGEDVFAVPWASPVAEVLSERGLRSLYGQLEDQEFALAGRAVQIVDWDQTHRFCGRCGVPTRSEPDERVKVCPNCGLHFYPRLAPAVIVLVHRGEQVLLARGARFPAAFYSTLAGFVEPGESLEETVVREIREEVGIEVNHLRYFGSQPWPFPHSLMIGFNADYAGGEIQVDGKEILDAGWFSADALPKIPPKPSIARALIDTWVRGHSERQP